MNIMIAEQAATVTACGAGPLVLDRLDMMRLLRPQWDALAAASDDVPLYLTYSYCEEVAKRAFAANRKIAVVQVFDGQTLVALWPFALELRGICDIARHLTCGNHEEYCRPLIRRGADHQQVTEIALEAAMQIGADVLELHYVQEDSALHSALRGTRQPRFLPDRLGRWGASSIALRQYATLDDYYRDVLSSGLRRNLKRQMKSLQAQGKVETGWCTSLADMRMVLQWLFETKRRWAKSRGIVTPWLQNDAVRDFHLALAQEVDLTTTPMVAYIKLDGVPIAASLSWIGTRVHEWCITTYDEAYHRYGVGVLLLEFLVQWSHERHLDFDFRFLVADYKDRWATHHETQKVRYVFLNRYARIHEGQMFGGAALRSLIHRRRRLVSAVKAKWRKHQS